MNLHPTAIIASHVLIVSKDDYGTPDVFGPFDSIEEAQAFAENYREAQNLPREASPENNDIWTDAGWYFDIVPLTK
jgi:hypothetical protein